MSKHPLSFYGDNDRDDRRGHVGSKVDCGGVSAFKELPYKPPVGPKGQMHNAPGLGGTNHGNKVNQGKH